MTGGPFHLAFPVHDLQSTRKFYIDTLGCSEGRSTESWVDFNFFGHQLSAHVAGNMTASASKVDGEQVPLPHFGVILSWDEFQRLTVRLKHRGVAFHTEPSLRFAGQIGEQMTMFIRDPSGNSLEFKAFRNPGQVFAT
ncbi:MAG: VOC family protein [Gammaproteobacteria bacterium]